MRKMETLSDMLFRALTGNPIPRHYVGFWFDGKDFHLAGPYMDRYEAIERLAEVAGNHPQRVIDCPARVGEQTEEFLRSCGHTPTVEDARKYGALFGQMTEQIISKAIRGGQA